MKTRAEAITGCLLGCAVGDALGLPAEGLSPGTIAKRFGALDRYHLLGRTGFVSDDTEQSALVAESLLVARRGDDFDAPSAVRHFRWRLRFWFARLPFGVGLATVRACVKLWLGLSRTGVHSAGNGAAMRSAVIGAVLCGGGAASAESLAATAGAPDASAARDASTATAAPPDSRDALRRDVTRRLAEVTHLDARAVEGALFVSELAASCAMADAGADRAALARAALQVVEAPSLRAALEFAVSLAVDGPDGGAAAKQLGTTGFVLHTVPLAAFTFVRHGGDAMQAIRATIRVGGDTDTNAAIVGGWAGALHGAAALPEPLLAALARGPFGRAHLTALGAALASPASTPPRWSALLAFARNLALYPVVLAHGFRRLLPF